MAYKTLGKTSEYIRELLPPETDSKIQEILQYADENHIPVLLPETAVFLKQLVKIHKPHKILEIGTAIGYSGHIMLLANEQSHLFTVEVDEKSISVAKKFFAQSGLSDRVTLYQGDAAEIVPLISGEFDFIFMDGPKSKYVKFLPYLERLLAPHGLLLSDNVLFNGWVSGENKMSYSKASIVVSLDEFLHTLMNDKNLLTSILNVGDGVSLSYKI